MEIKHSTLPWSIEKDGDKIYIVDGSGTIARVGPCGIPDEEDEANAELIDRAVNTHEELVEQLKVMTEMVKRNRIRYTTTNRMMPEADKMVYVENARTVLKKCGVTP